MVAQLAYESGNMTRDKLFATLNGNISQILGGVRLSDGFKMVLQLHGHRFGHSTTVSVSNTVPRTRFCTGCGWLSQRGQRSGCTRQGQARAGEHVNPGATRFTVDGPHSGCQAQRRRVKAHVRGEATPKPMQRHVTHLSTLLCGVSYVSSPVKACCVTPCWTLLKPLPSLSALVPCLRLQKPWR